MYIRYIFVRLRPSSLLFAAQEVLQDFKLVICSSRGLAGLQACYLQLKRSCRTSSLLFAAQEVLQDSEREREREREREKEGYKLKYLLLTAAFVMLN